MHTFRTTDYVSFLYVTEVSRPGSTSLLRSLGSVWEYSVHTGYLFMNSVKGYELEKNKTKKKKK